MISDQFKFSIAIATARTKEEHLEAYLATALRHGNFIISVKPRIHSSRQNIPNSTRVAVMQYEQCCACISFDQKVRVTLTMVDALCGKAAVQRQENMGKPSCKLL